MTVEPGRSLLHYRLVEQIGEGGMGVVWRAVDSTLDREVALKLLPPAFSEDRDRLQRFAREARVLASLNHQNIATIHGFHSADDVHFLAMEMVAGEDLAQRIAREPISVESAVEIALQVARALEAAHARGIVHRDLKPANVKLTASGDAKVLDFGLAKALAPDSDPDSGVTSPSMSPTLTSAGTVAGMILGTAAYMAPEQARGRPVDRRADLWAFGCLLFEMLAGKRCFAGETVSDTLAAVLKEEPDWTVLPAETPPAVRRLLRRCLTKDPRNRLSDAADARIELAEAFDADPDGAATGPPEVAPAAAARLPWMVAAVAVLAALATLLVSGMRPETLVTSPERPLHLSILAPGSVVPFDSQEQLLALSPDGRTLVFSGIEDSIPAPALYLRALDGAAVERLPGTDESLNPFFSPDGQWVGFFASGWLKKIRLGTTTAIPVCEARGGPRGASWGADDRIVFSPSFNSPLLVVPAAGGQPVRLTELDVDRKERTHRWPHVVPGHDVVLFTVATTDSPEFYDDARIDALRLSTGERKTIFEGASAAMYASTGHLIVARGGFLHAVPFDVDTLEIRGTPQPVLENVAGAENSGAVYAAIADEGFLVYVAGRPSGARNRLTWLHADGRNEPVPGFGLGGYLDPALSPDGKRIAVAVAGDRSRDIWVHDLERETRVRLTFNHENGYPIWTPDGKSVAFSSIRDGLGSAYITASDGSGQPRLLHSRPGSSSFVTDISKDGTLALMEVSVAATDLYVKSLVDEAGEPVPFLQAPGEEVHGVFSPDGRWVAYSSDETGNFEVFVRPYPGPGGRWQISENLGDNPLWSRDGRQIHYRVNRSWWVVDVDPGDGPGQPFRTGTPRLVRSDLPRVGFQQRNQALSLDGTAMLLQVPEGDRASSGEFRVIIHWFDELQRLVPTE